MTYLKFRASVVTGKSGIKMRYLNLIDTSRHITIRFKYLIGILQRILFMAVGLNAEDIIHAPLKRFELLLCS